MAPGLSIIIVNWNGGDLIRNCLASLRDHSPAVDYEVIVVDNASTDGSVDWLRSEEAKAMIRPATLRLIANRDNVGFGRANNQAFASSEASLVFLLNPDTEVQAGALDTLIASLRENDRVGVCGPRLIMTDGSVQPSVWHNPTPPWEVVVSGLKLHYLIPKRWRGRFLLGHHWDHAHRRFARRLSGAALLVRRKVIDQVGGFDERFYMYGEDVEWCLRIHRAGWLLLFEPAAVVVHHASSSAIQRWGPLETFRRVAEGQLQFQSYVLSRPRLIVNLVISFLVALVSYVAHVLTRRSTEELRTLLALYAEYFKRAVRPKQVAPSEQSVER